MKFISGPLLFLVMVYDIVCASGQTDSLGMAKSLIQGGKYSKAEKLLQALHQSHPDDLNIFWLFGQTAYWANHYKTFDAVYTEAIQQFPDNYYLKLDYAVKLVDYADVKKAMPFLELYRAYDSANTDLNLALAKINFWNGHYTEALQILNSYAFKKEQNKEARQLKQEVLRAISPWAKINGNYLTDDQPLQAITLKLEAGTYVNSLWSPYISVNAPSFLLSSDSKFAQSIAIGDKLNFFKKSVVINLNAGLIKFPNQSNSWTGTVEITKTSFKYLQLHVKTDHQPYFITLSSLTDAIIPYHHQVSAAWNNMNSWNGALIANLYRFDSDYNSVYNFGGWVFAPPVKFSVLKLRFGYAYGFNSSAENRFNPKLTLQEVISSYNPGNIAIKGIYNPYFTPKNQSVHSAIFNVSYNLRKQLVIGANANLSFLGTTENPHLYLDKNSSGETIINRGYSEVKFYPKEISAFFLFQLNSKLSLKADYTLLQNNFYISHLTGITLKASFWNEKKGG